MKIRIGKGVFSQDAHINLENSAGWIVTGPPGVGKSKVLTVTANNLLKINKRTKIVVVSATRPFDYDISGDFEFINGIRNKEQLFELLERQRDSINMRLDAMNTLKTTDVKKIDEYFPDLLLMDELESIEDSFSKSELQRYAELVNYRILMGRKVHHFTGLFSQTSNIDFSVLKTRSLDQRLIASPSLALCKALGVGDEYAKFDADVVPHFVHRRYSENKSYIEGVALRTPEKRIFNWPAQDYKNGVDKNEATGKRYKAFVRVLKNMRSEMSNRGYASAKKMPSYLLACLGWNVPNFYFDDPSYLKMTEDCLEYLLQMTSDLNNVSEWGEVNELKYLFRTSQPWTREDCYNFLLDARKFLKDL